MKKIILISAFLISAFSENHLIAGHNETQRNNRCRWFEPARFKASTHIGFSGQGGTSGSSTSCHQADHYSSLSDFFIGCVGTAESHVGYSSTGGVGFAMRWAICRNSIFIILSY